MRQKKSKMRYEDDNHFGIAGCSVLDFSSFFSLGELASGAGTASYWLDLEEAVSSMCPVHQYFKSHIAASTICKTCRKDSLDLKSSQIDIGTLFTCESNSAVQIGANEMLAV